MDVIHENETHFLEREFIRQGDARGWHFSLVSRETGHAKTMIAQDKNAFNGVTCEKFLKWANRAPWQPLYKAGRLTQQKTKELRT